MSSTFRNAKVFCGEIPLTKRNFILEPEEHKHKLYFKGDTIFTYEFIKLRLYYSYHLMMYNYSENRQEGIILVKWRIDKLRITSLDVLEFLIFNT